MSRGPKTKFEDPSLGQALSWLRARTHLTQGQVCERAQMVGQSLSEVYYGLCERGQRYPSEKSLLVILEALGSSREELEGLLNHKPWQITPKEESHYRSLRSTPKAFVSPPQSAFAQTQEGEALGGIKTNARSSLGVSFDARSGISQNQTSGASPSVYGELAEISSLFINLPRSDQLNLLGYARKRGKKKN